MWEYSEKYRLSNLFVTKYRFLDEMSPIVVSANKNLK